MWQNGWMQHIDLDEIRDELDEKEQDLRERIASLTQVSQPEEPISFGKRIGDGTTQAIQQAADVATAESLQQTLDEVEAARQRLDDGTFGRCVVCGVGIPAGGLEFRPWSATCVDHAQ